VQGFFIDHFFEKLELADLLWDIRVKIGEIRRDDEMTGDSGKLKTLSDYRDLEVMKPC
jgi:hypothetical protein